MRQKKWSSAKGPIPHSYVPFPGCRTQTQDIIRDQEGSYRFPKETFQHVAQFLHNVLTSPPRHRTSRQYHCPSPGFSGICTASGRLTRAINQCFFEGGHIPRVPRVRQRVLLRRTETKPTDTVHDRIPQSQLCVHTSALRVMVPISHEMFHVQHPEEKCPRATRILSATLQRHNRRQ